MTTTAIENVKPGMTVRVNAKRFSGFAKVVDVKIVGAADPVAARTWLHVVNPESGKVTVVPFAPGAVVEVA